MKDKRKIFAEDLIEALRDDPSINGANFRKLKQHIEEVPDAVEVVHGRWEPHPEVNGYERCSVCHDCIIYDDWVEEPKWYYCPNCGAKMDGDGKCE